MVKIAQFSMWLLMLMFVAGCNLDNQALPTPNQDNVIYVTATPSLPTPNANGEILITATADSAIVDLPTNPLPTSELPPTVALSETNPTTDSVATAVPVVTSLDVPPQDALRDADTRLLYGYYEDAIAIYELILAQGDLVDADIRAQAAYQAGRSALLGGFFDVALNFFTQVIQAYPESPAISRSYFLRGDAYLGLSQWQAAIDDFQQYLNLAPGLIDSYAYERIADAQLALGDSTTALANYAQALTAGRTLVPELVLREKIARIYINLGQIDNAVAQYDAILAVAQNSGYRAQVELYATQALINSGNTSDGVPRARRIFDTYPSTASAYTALQILIDNDVVIDGFSRGKVLYNFGDYNAAISAFNDYSSSYELDAIPAELYLLLGRAYREIGNPQAAQIAFQTLIAQFPADPLFGDALLEQGRTFFLSGDIPTAIQTYISIADNYGYLADAASEALWRAGYLYGVNNDPVASRQLFIRLADAYPQSEWATNGLFLATSTAVQNNDFAIAENLYGRIAALTTGEDQAAAYYWVGKLATQRGDTSAAPQAFALAEAAAPDSYFAARVRDINAGLLPFQPPAQVTFQFDIASEKAQAESWLQNTFGISLTGDLSRLSPELATDARLVRGAELWTVGAFEEAQREFSALLEEKRSAGDGLASYQLAVYLRDKGALYWSIVAAADVINAAGVSTLDAPAYIARMRYPAYFHELVTEQSDAYGFDPLLLLSLMRQESLFNTAAISSASAKGLTQVIPSTGQYIANQLGVENYQDSDLWRPHIAIAFGAFYLDEQLRLFDGNAAAALAAYNAGPGRALDWVALAGDDVDLLVTTITFEETQQYLQRIYSHYNIYRILYRAGA